jgi:hypothetical protein
VSNLSGLVGRIPRPILAGIAGLGVIAVVAAVVTMSGGGDPGGQPSPTFEPGATAPDLPPTTVPLPTATPEPPPNRADCGAIRGTPYLSDDEANWYHANCASFDAPAVAASGTAQVPLGDRLVIPGAGVNTEIHRATVPSSGVMPDPVGYFNAVWYDFSAWPGLGGYVNSGNLVLSGHVDCGRCINGGPGTAVFWTVRNLKAGDRAEYRTADGKTTSYVVTESKAVSPASNFEEILASSRADMTVITCTGTFSGGEYNQRHIVHFKKA